MYDPSTGEWLSNDPLLFAGGQDNLREYVGDDPVNATDPSGMDSVSDNDGKALPDEPLAAAKPLTEAELLSRKRWLEASIALGRIVLVTGSGPHFEGLPKIVNPEMEAQHRRMIAQQVEKDQAELEEVHRQLGMLPPPEVPALVQLHEMPGQAPAQGAPVEGARAEGQGKAPPAEPLPGSAIKQKLGLTGKAWETLPDYLKVGLYRWWASLTITDRAEVNVMLAHYQADVARTWGPDTVPQWLKTREPGVELPISIEPFINRAQWEERRRSPEFARDLQAAATPPTATARVPDFDIWSKERLKAGLGLISGDLQEWKKSDLLLLTPAGLTFQMLDAVAEGEPARAVRQLVKYALFAGAGKALAWGLGKIAPVVLRALKPLMRVHPKAELATKATEAYVQAQKTGRATAQELEALRGAAEKATGEARAAIAAEKLGQLPSYQQKALQEAEEYFKSQEQLLKEAGNTGTRAANETALGSNLTRSLSQAGLKESAALQKPFKVGELEGVAAAEQQFLAKLKALFKQHSLDFKGFQRAEAGAGSEFVEGANIIRLEENVSVRTVLEEVQHAIDYAKGIRSQTEITRLYADLAKEIQEAGATLQPLANLEGPAKGVIMDIINARHHQNVFRRLIDNIKEGELGLGGYSGLVRDFEEFLGSILH